MKLNPIWGSGFSELPVDSIHFQLTIMMTSKIVHKTDNNDDNSQNKDDNDNEDDKDI